MHFQFSDFYGFFVPIPPVICICYVMFTVQKYTDELSHVLGIYHKKTKSLSVLPKPYFIAYGFVELKVSTLIDVIVC